MITNFICRSAALLTLSFCLTISTEANSQVSKVLSVSNATTLLKTGDAGILRTHLVDQLKGKLENTPVGETFTLTGSGRTINCDLVSQTVTVGREKLEQISIVYKESGVTRTLDLVQYANGDLGKLEGNNLVAYSLLSNRLECLNELFGPGGDCAACKTKVLNCLGSSTRFLKQASCLLRSIDGSCLRCGVDYYLVWGCAFG